MVDQLVGVPADPRHVQVIDVPKISLDSIPVMPQRRVRTVPNSAEERRGSTAQFLGVGLTRCNATTGAGSGPDGALSVEVPQLQFVVTRRHSCCGAEANPDGTANCEETVDPPQVQFFAWLWTSAACAETSEMSPWTTYL